MTRPYIIEALVPVLDDEPDECAENASCSPTCRVMRLLKRRHAWTDPKNQVVARIEIGENWWTAGELWVRALVHARVPLEEVAEPDGENLAIHIPQGEIFQAEDRRYYVTRHRAHSIDGIFVLNALQGMDGHEIPDIKAHLMPLIVKDLTKRILRHMGLDTLPAEAAALVETVTSKRFADKNALLDIDPIDLEDAADELVERLQVPGHCTDDMYRLDAMSDRD